MEGELVVNELKGSRNGSGIGWRELTYSGFTLRQWCGGNRWSRTERHWCFLGGFQDKSNDWRDKKGNCIPVTQYFTFFFLTQDHYYKIIMACRLWHEDIMMISVENLNKIVREMMCLVSFLANEWHSQYILTVWGGEVRVYNINTQKCIKKSRYM